MGVYLEDHPPARSQFRKTRRAQVTGAIVLHTAENTPDLTLPDGGAEAVARFISTRTDAAGSYHSVADSDSVVRVGRYEWEMFHEGTGGNRWSLGLSWACHAHQWPTLPDTWYRPAIQNGAAEAARMARWVEDTTGIVVPARRISAQEYRARKPGFTSHAELDPTRRSDPGQLFPWWEFLAAYKVAYNTGGEMLDLRETKADVLKVQQTVNAAGYDPVLVEDGILGPNTWKGVVWLVNQPGPGLDPIIAALDSRYGR